MLHRLRLQILFLMLGCLAWPEWSAAQSITYGQAVYGAVVYSQSVPGSPTITGAIVVGSQATVTFTPPTDTGGGVITGYTVTAAGGGISITSTCASSPCVVSGLTNGVAYSFTATANSAEGSSVQSTARKPGAETAIPALPAYSLTVLILILLFGALRRLKNKAHG